MDRVQGDKSHEASKSIKIMKIPLGTASLVILTLLLSSTLSSNPPHSIDNSHPEAIPTGGLTFAAGWAATPPIIDGTFSSKEWQSAATIEFNITYNIGDRITPGILYVLNDASNLYLGVKVKDTSFNQGDVLEFFFDNNNTGVMTKGDDVLQFDVTALMTSHIGFFDEFLNSYPAGLGQTEDRAVVGGTTDGTGAGSGDGQYDYFEISHPLNSGDKGHDISLKPGDTFGLLVRYDDDGRIGSFWPGETPGTPVYSFRAQITLATASMPDFSISAYAPLPFSLAYYGTLVRPPLANITIGELNGFTGTVALSDNVPSGLSCSPITPPIVSPPFPVNATLRCGTFNVSGNYTVTVKATSGRLVHMGTVTFRFSDFKVGASDPAPVNPGESAVSTVSVYLINGFYQPVVLTDTVPPGLDCGAITLDQITHTAALSCSSMTLGSFTVTIDGTSGALSHTTTATFTFALLPDFTLTASSPVPVIVGTSAESIITVTPLNGFAGVVIVTDIAPVNLSCLITSILNYATRVLVCTSGIVGTYKVTLTGWSGTLSHSINTTFTFIPPPDFTFTANPANMTVQAGNTASSSLILTSLNGFTGTILLSIDSSSSFASLDPQSVTLYDGRTGSSMLTIRPSSTLPPGRYNIRITAVSGSTSHNVTVQIIVTTLPAQRILGLNPPTFYMATGFLGVAIAIAASLLFLRRKRPLYPL